MPTYMPRKSRLQIQKKASTQPSIDPCPFCGSQGEWNLSSRIISIVCSSCGASGPTAGNNIDAIRLWNDRIKPEIVVRKRSDDHGDYKTVVKNNECYWGCGKSQDAAVGSLIQSHPEQFGISIKREF